MARRRPGQVMLKWKHAFGREGLRRPGKNPGVGFNREWPDRDHLGAALPITPHLAPLRP